MYKSKIIAYIYEKKTNLNRVVLFVKDASILSQIADTRTYMFALIIIMLNCVKENNMFLSPLHGHVK